jgi:uncharacterized membrane protein YphA (DoxX/SURF4 family)
MRLPSVSIPELLLRIGVALAFIYPPISALIDPFAWIGYFPPFLLDSAGSGELVLLHLFGLLEIAIALWILIGRNIWIPSVVATVMLLAIVALNLSQLDVLFRDISIALMSSALMYLHRPRRHGNA